MDVRGQQLLAGSRFADEQHAGIRPCAHGRLFHRARECGTRSDHLGTGAYDFAQLPILGRELRLPQRVLDGYQDTVPAERLLEKIERAGASRFHGVGNGGVARNHNYRRRNLLLLYGPQQVDPVTIFEPHIEQEDIGSRNVGKLAEFGDGAESVYRVPFALENHAQRAPDVVFVVNYEDSFGSHSPLVRSRETRLRPARR